MYIPFAKYYIERQVDSEIPPIQDADGNSILDCFDFFVLLPGDNHCGYIGFRGLPPFQNILRSDGSMGCSCTRLAGLNNKYDNNDDWIKFFVSQ